MKNEKNMVSKTDVCRNVWIILILIQLFTGSTAESIQKLGLVKLIPVKADLPKINILNFGLFRIRDLLVDGWESNSRWGRSVSVNWVTQKHATLMLPASKITNKLLFMRIYPYEINDSSEQWCEIKINNVPLHRIKLEKYWWSYELRIPKYLLNLNNNFLDLEFSYVGKIVKPKKLLLIQNNYNSTHRSKPIGNELKPANQSRAVAFDYIIFYDEDVMDLETQINDFKNNFVVIKKRKYNGKLYDTFLYYPQGSVSIPVHVKPRSILEFVPITWKIVPHPRTKDFLNFYLTIKDQSGKVYQLFEKKVFGRDQPGYKKVKLDLSSFTNQDVVLTFTSETFSIDGYETMVGVWGNPVIYEGVDGGKVNHQENVLTR